MNSFSNAAPHSASAISAQESPPLALAAPTVTGESVFGETVFCSTVRLTPDKNQPRKSFPETELNQLAATIKGHGILEPILTTMPGDDDVLTILAGERRWRAAQVVGLAEVPCRIALRRLSIEETLAIHLIENTTQQAIPALELAQSLQQLKQLRPRSLSELAAVVGLHTSTVSRLLSLLRLPEPIRAMIDKELSPAVAGEIAKLKTGDKLAVAEKAARENLSRDQVAALVARSNASRNPPATAKAASTGRRVTFHVADVAAELVVSVADGNKLTLETVMTAADAVAKKAKRLYQGAGDLKDLANCFPKNKLSTPTPANGAATHPSRPQHDAAALESRAERPSKEDGHA